MTSCAACFCSLEHAQLVPEGNSDLWHRIRRFLGASAINFPEAATLLDTDPPISCASFSQDGLVLVTGGSDGKVRLHDGVTGHLRLEIPLFTMEKVKSITSVAIRQNKSGILAWNGQQIRTWDLDNRRRLGPPIAVEDTRKDQNRTDNFVTLEFNFDGTLIVSTNNDRKGASQACAWDAKTGRLVGAPIPFKGIPGSGAAAFRPDGKAVLVRVNDREARLFDTRTSEPIGSPIRSDGVITSVAFGPDSQTVLTGESKGKAQIRDVRTGQPIGSPLRIPVQDNCVATFSRDGKTIVTLSGQYGSVWDSGTRQVRAAVDVDSLSANLLSDFNSDGLCVYREFGHPVIWDLLTGRTISSWHYHRADGDFMSMVDTATGFRFFSGSQYTVAFDPVRSTLLYVQTVRKQSYPGLWRLEPIVGSKEILSLWAETLACAVLGSDDQPISLGEEAWQTRRARLGAL